jgi:hypothetical protein
MTRTPAEASAIGLFAVWMLVAAALFLIAQEFPTSDPVILENASGQVLVVSIAEVVVCWALLASVLRKAVGPSFVSVAISVLAAALAFGVHHFTHSPAFNTPSRVLLLSGLGAATELFFFLGRDLYSSIVRHYGFAVRGVVQAPGDGGISTKLPVRSFRSLSDFSNVAQQPAGAYFRK